jgi:hypothetical protein
MNLAFLSNFQNKDPAPKVKMAQTKLIQMTGAVEANRRAFADINNKRKAEGTPEKSG